VPSRPSIELAGVAEIAALLGVSRQRVDQLVREHADFPKPVAELAAGRIWLKPEVVAWARRAGRLPRSSAS
jgi:predicted DNA-binding transcriptional regulator AlpA